MTLPIQIGIRWGIIATFISILAFVIPYIIGSTIIYNMWYGFFFFFLWLILIFLTARDLRAQQDGAATLSELFQSTFVSFALMTLVMGLFNYVFYNYIDPSYANTLKQHIIESTQSMLENFGAPPETIEQSISQLEAQDLSMSLKNIALTSVKSLIFGLFICLIVSAIMQKRRHADSNKQEMA